MTRAVAQWIAALAATFVTVALAGAPQAAGGPGDPFIPDPPIWCPGNDPNAFVASGYGGFCEGRTYSATTQRLQRPADVEAEQEDVTAR